MTNWSKELLNGLIEYKIQSFGLLRQKEADTKLFSNQAGQGLWAS